MKNTTPSRRDFIARSSMWLAALGVAPHIRIDLIEKWGKKLGIADNPLYANDLSQNKAQFVIELVVRAGFPLDSIVAPRVDTLEGRVSMCATDNTPEGRLARRAAAHLPQSVTTFAGSNPGTNLYLTPWASSLNSLVNDGTIGIAGCQAILTNGGHQSNFATRMVQTNSGQINANGAPCPTIHFLDAMPKSTILGGVEWKQNDNTTLNNRPAGFNALTRISGGTNQSLVGGVMLSQKAQNFLGLFSPSVIPFSPSEANLIASASEKLNKNYVTYRSMNNSDSVVATSRLGFDLLTRDFRAALTPSAAEYSDWDMATSRGGVRLGESMNLLAKAFNMGLIRGATITIDSGDWHNRAQNINFSDPSFNPDTTDYAVYGRTISNAIARLYTLAKTLPNPLVPGTSVADGLVVQLSSEFSRTFMNMDCNDHGDGGTNGIVIIGPTAKNISGANWDHQTGGTVSIDRVSGQLDLGAPLFSTGSAYATFCASLGIPAPSISRFTSESAILAMLK